jgi:hypothetical protein
LRSGLFNTNAKTGLYSELDTKVNTLAEKLNCFTTSKGIVGNVFITGHDFRVFLIIINFIAPGYLCFSQVPGVYGLNSAQIQEVSVKIIIYSQLLSLGKGNDIVFVHKVGRLSWKVQI